MSANQQRWMGGIILLGGSALLASFLFQGNGQKSTVPQVAPVDKTLNLEPTHRFTPPSNGVSNQPIDGQNAANQPVQLTPLAVDVDTERKLLAAQHDMREKKVAEQEARTAEFLARQQQAEANSANRVAAEQSARLAARRAKEDDALKSTDPAAPDLAVGPDDDASKAAALKAEQRRQDAKDREEQSRLRAQKAAENHDSAQKLVAQAAEKTAKAKAEREAAEKKQIQEQKEQHDLQVKQRQEKLAKEKQAKLDAEKEKKALEAKQHQEKLAQEKQDKLDAAQEKLDTAKAKQEAEKAAKLKIAQAEKAERARLKAATADADDKEALQAQVDKNKKEAAILKAKLDKLNGVSPDSTAVKDAQKTKDAERARALLEGASAPATAASTTPAPAPLVMIQVAMAESQAKADAMVSQLRAKGYKVRTSTTTKGVRVLVGPEKDATAATATKHKIEQDSSLNVKGAWVSNWQPPTS